MIDLNELGKEAYVSAWNRGKVVAKINHKRDAIGICEELFEFNSASEEKPSEHLPIYTEAEEELADVLICCLTALHMRHVDIERIIQDKISYNQKREIL